jgi:hypothetical protein
MNINHCYLHEEINSGTRNCWLSWFIGPTDFKIYRCFRTMIHTSKVMKRYIVSINEKYCGFFKYRILKISSYIASKVSFFLHEKIAWAVYACLTRITLSCHNVWWQLSLFPKCNSYISTAILHYHFPVRWVFMIIKSSASIIFPP